MPQRRQFLLGAGSSLIAVPALGQAPARPFVSSDFAPLRRVLVAEPSTSDYQVSLTDESLLPEGRMPAEAVEQHRGLSRLLTASGAEVLELSSVLQGAIDTARREGAWRTWLRATNPRLSSRADAVTADTLLGRDATIQFEADDAGAYRHFMDGAGAKMFTRDIGVMTPGGMVLSNFLFPHRRSEAVLARFMFDFSPDLRRYPIQVDFVEEDLIAEGGDFQVVDERTLMMATGNRTDPRAAPLLARRLNMDVLAVQSRKVDLLLRSDRPNPLRRMLLHLDTYFTHLGPRRALALPWLLESGHADNNLLSRFFEGMGQTGAVSQDDVTMAKSYLADFGRVKRYSAGTGARDTTVADDVKLVDYARSQGYEVTFVGGTPPERPDFEYLFQVVIDEHGRQAANVVATAPGQVIGYAGSPRTLAAVQASGARIDTFAARELWPLNGGPHCLTLPLERG